MNKLYRRRRMCRLAAVLRASYRAQDAVLAQFTSADYVAAHSLPDVQPRIIPPAPVPRVADPLDYPPYWARRPGPLTPLADAMRQANEEMHKP